MDMSALTAPSTTSGPSTWKCYSAVAMALGVALLWTSSEAPPPTYLVAPQVGARQPTVQPAHRVARPMPAQMLHPVRQGTTDAGVQRIATGAGSHVPGPPSVERSIAAPSTHVAATLTVLLGAVSVVTALAAFMARGGRRAVASMQPMAMAATTGNMPITKSQPPSTSSAFFL